MESKSGARSALWAAQALVKVSFDGVEPDPHTPGRLTSEPST